MSENLDKIYDEYTKNEWTDGLPIIPPTETRVKGTLAFTDRQPDDSLGRVPFTEDECTIEAAAVNAVMAGCKPEYFPVVLAELEAMLDRPNLRGVLATTGFVWPVGMANGPIPREIGMHCGWGALGTGPMHRANVTIGRTMTLVCQNIGKSIPGVSEKKPLYNMGRFGICLMENEADSPWEPLHVEKGFDITTSTVCVYDEFDLRRGFEGSLGRSSGVFGIDIPARAKKLAQTLSPHGLRRNDWILVMTAAQAIAYANEGWSKNDVKNFYFQHCRTNLKEWYTHYPPATREYALGCDLAMAPNWIFDKDRNIIADDISIFDSPERIWIFVTGPKEEVSHVWIPSSHHGEHPAVIKPILLADGTPAKSVYDFKSSK